MQEALERFAEEVRRQRKKKHLTQMQLAEKLGMNHRTIIHIENCKKVPGFDTVVYIARELKIILDPILFPNAASGGILNMVARYSACYDMFRINRIIFFALRCASPSVMPSESFREATRVREAASFFCDTTPGISTST